MTDAELQKALNSLAYHHNQVQKYRGIISEESQARWGFDPADINNDAFIDGVDGGCGLSNGMTVADFKQSMDDGASI